MLPFCFTKLPEIGTIVNKTFIIYYWSEIRLLSVKVGSLEGLLANIRNAIDEIDTNASANEQVAEKISDALM
ncbi:MAG: hypothetical protein J5597_03620 [Spirochaetaceae bacterium]|nr:hypothetical protein [Spirochaetaceae bacterium]